MRYPYLFLVQDRQANGDPAKNDEGAKYFVKIAKSSDYRLYDSSWMCDPDLPTTKDVLVPDIDQLEDDTQQVVFDSEIEAWQFIQKWWASQPI